MACLVVTAGVRRPFPPSACATARGRSSPRGMTTSWPRSRPGREAVDEARGHVDQVEQVTVERHLTSYSLRRSVWMMSLTIARSTVTAWRDLPATVWLLVAARAVNRLGAFTLPFLSLTLVAELGASVAQAGYLLAAFGLATIPSRLVGGRLSDRWGPRATIVGGLAATAVAQLLVAASQSLVQVAFAVVLLGLAFEVYEPPSQSLVADATSPQQRPVAFGLLAAAIAAAGMAAGLLAAVLAGFDLRWLFVADAVTCLACAAVVRWRLPARSPRRPTPDDETRVQPWRDRRLLADDRARHRVRCRLPPGGHRPAADRHRPRPVPPRRWGCCSPCRPRPSSSGNPC